MRCERRRGEDEEDEESGGMTAKKQEPHTEMWGISVYMCVSDGCDEKLTNR